MLLPCVKDKQDVSIFVLKVDNSLSNTL